MSQFPPAAGASGGPQVRPTRLKAPKYIRLSGPELDALWNRTGHELAGTVYLLLIAGSVFAGKYGGTGLVTYAQLQSLCRPPRPQQGQWAPPPTLKRMRTCLAALESAGLVARDQEGNKAQGQLRYRLPHRESVGTS